MSDPTPSSRSPSPEVRAHLHTVARLLREVPHLGPKAQQLLAELVDELSRALESGPVPPAEAARPAAELPVEFACPITCPARTTSERSPVLSLLSFSIPAMTDLRARAACSPLISGLIAAFTLPVTSSIDISTLSSRSTHFFSSARERA